MRNEFFNEYVKINLALEINKKNTSNLIYLKDKIHHLLKTALQPAESDLILALDVKAQVYLELVDINKETN